MKFVIKLILLNFLLGCSIMNYSRTEKFVDLPRFMGDWYVQGGRFTFLEKGAHNAKETYVWNKENERVDIFFSFNKGSFEGKKTVINQKGWIENNETNAWWKISPFWPLKFDYLILLLGKDYEWVSIGVPSGKYLWIMSKNKEFSKVEFKEVIQKLKLIGYPTNDLMRVPHKMENSI